MQINRFIQIVTLLVLICGVIYSCSALRNRFLFDTTKQLNSELKSVIFDSIIFKYSNVISGSQSDENIFYIGRLLKLKAELTQAISNLDNILVMVYNQKHQMIFCSHMIQEELSNANSKNYIYPQNHGLYEYEIQELRDDLDFVYNDGDKVISVFKLAVNSSEDESQKYIFLKIIRSYKDFSDSVIDFYVLTAMISILISVMIAVYLQYRYNQNNKILIDQHELNLKLKAEKEFAESESLSKSAFFANITHELRTPLNSIIGFSEILKKESLGPIENKLYLEYVDDIYNSGTHLLNLINDILDLSKAESNKLNINPIKFDLNKMLDSCIRMFATKAQESNILIEKDMSLEHVVMFTDINRLKQVVINLLSNSIKFTKEGGKIQIKVEKSEKTICIIVEDTGVGIAKQDIPKVLSVFGQADNELSKKYHSSGLGLPLSKKLVELMGGTFEIESTPGVGTIISIKFPINV